MDTSFANTEEYRWLRNNAHRYGFEHSYPDNSRKAGATYEPWHLRFVGTPEAQETFKDVPFRSVNTKKPTAKKAYGHSHEKHASNLPAAMPTMNAMVEAKQVSVPDSFSKKELENILNTRRLMANTQDLKADEVAITLEQERKKAQAKVATAEAAATKRRESATQLEIVTHRQKDYSRQDTSLPAVGADNPVVMVVRRDNEGPELIVTRNQKVPQYVTGVAESQDYALLDTALNSARSRA